MDWLIKKAKSCFFIVALVDSSVVGTGSLDGERIKAVFVDPDFLRIGIGQALMRELRGMRKALGLVMFF